MKKEALILCIFVLVMVMTACGNSGQPDKNSSVTVSDSVGLEASYSFLIPSDKSPTEYVFKTTVEELDKMMRDQPAGDASLPWTKTEEVPFEGGHNYIFVSKDGSYFTGLNTDSNNNIQAAYSGLSFDAMSAPNAKYLNPMLEAAFYLQVLQVYSDFEYAKEITNQMWGETSSFLTENPDATPLPIYLGGVSHHIFFTENHFVYYVIAGDYTFKPNETDFGSSPGEVKVPHGSLQDDFEYYYENYYDYVDGYLTGLDAGSPGIKAMSSSEYMRGYNDGVADSPLTFGDGKSNFNPEGNRNSSSSGSRSDGSVSGNNNSNNLSSGSGNLSYIGTVIPPDGLNIRSAPSISADIIASARTGKTMKITGEVIWGDGYHWYPVEYEGKAGYAAAEFLEIK